MRTLAVVIVSLNAGAFSGQCLRSEFTETRDSEMRVTVVDNGSTDGSLEIVGREFPHVRVIKNGRNLGFAAAANIALREIRDAGEADYVLLLNPDTIILDGAIDKLADYLEIHPDVGAVSPALILPDGCFQTGTGGHLPTARSAFDYFFFVFKFFPRPAKSLFFDQRRFARSKNPVAAEWLSGACLLLRRDVLTRAGLLDERYFFYGEDIAWGKTMTRRGIRLLNLPWARVVHHHGFSLKGRGGAANILWLEMLYRYVRRERGRTEYFLFRLFSIGGFLLRWGAYSLAGLGRRDPALRSKARDSARFLAAALKILPSPPNPPLF